MRHAAYRPTIAKFIIAAVDFGMQLGLYNIYVHMYVVPNDAEIN